MSLRRTPLGDAHEDAGVSLTEFGGWEMPVEFTSIREEHRAVRESVGRFDVSHMGEVVVSGADAAALTRRLVTSDADDLGVGEAQYTAITDEDGVMLDDVVVYRLPRGWSAEYLVVPNAGHDASTTERWREYRDEWDLDATVENVTDEWGLIAVQGPDAEATLAAAGANDLDDLGRFEATTVSVGGATCLVSRTGYTGEDGFEIFVPRDATPAVWERIDAPRCGLGARDTLRIEMGYLLSGQDFDPETEPHTPFEAGIGFAVDLGEAFVGRDALAEQAEGDLDEQFVGFEMRDRHIPRHGYEVTAGDETVGRVTSGTMSPTLEEPVGLGYVAGDRAEPGTEVGVVVRGETKRARVVSPPFLEGY